MESDESFVEIKEVMLKHVEAVMRKIYEDRYIYIYTHRLELVKRQTRITRLNEIAALFVREETGKVTCTVHDPFQTVSSFKLQNALYWKYWGHNVFMFLFKYCCKLSTTRLLLLQSSIPCIYTFSPL